MTPESLALPALPARPALPIVKCMITFLFQVPEQPEVHTGRVFLEGVANLHTQDQVLKAEQAILDHHKGTIAGVTVIDWRPLEG